MSLHITIFGPTHYFWNREVMGVWFHRPDEHSTGGVGFCIPFLHVCFMWGGD